MHLADLGTRVFYTQYGGFDVHANEVETQNKLWLDVSGAISDFFADLREHDASENVVMLVFTEFGRRVRDNGNGTDHGSGGGSFLIGDRVKGGMYAEYPLLAPESAARRRPALQLRLSRPVLQRTGPVARTGRRTDSGRHLRANFILGVTRERQET